MNNGKIDFSSVYISKSNNEKVVKPIKYEYGISGKELLYSNENDGSVGRIKTEDFLNSYQIVKYDQIQFEDNNVNKTFNSQDPSLNKELSSILKTENIKKKTPEKDNIENVEKENIENKTPEKDNIENVEKENIENVEKENIKNINFLEKFKVKEYNFNINLNLKIPKISALVLYEDNFENFEDDLKKYISNLVCNENLKDIVNVLYQEIQKEVEDKKNTLLD